MQDKPRSWLRQIARKAPAPAETSDPLLACLAAIVRASGQLFSQEAALAGLPLVAGEHLSARLFPRAAAQYGLKAELIARKPSEVPALVVPFIALLADGGAALVQSLDPAAARAVIALPGVSKQTRTVRLADLDAQATGEVLLVARDETLESEPRARAGAQGHWFWSGMARLWPSWLQVGVAAFLINVLSLAVPIFVMSVYDRVIPNQSQPTLWALTAGVLIALVFDLLLKQLRAGVLDQAGGQIDMAAFARLFRQALALPMAERQQAPGALASQIREFETVREFFASSSIVAVTDLLFVGVIVAVMFSLVGPVTWVVVAALPVVLLLTLILQWPLARAVRTSQAQSSRRQVVLIESLSAIETVKAAGAESIMQRRFEDAVAATLRASLWTRFWSQLNINLIGLIQQAVSVAIVVWGVFLAIDGQITVGGIIAASMLAGRVLAPLGSIAMLLTRAQAALSSMGGLNALMRKPADNAGVHSGAGIEDASLEFKGVTFTYPDAPSPALSNVSFRIAPGERIGVIGRVGSGKTTLGKLADGLWAPDTGTILVGGREIRSVEAAELRAHVGLVTQDIELFSGTVYDNIVVGARDLSEEAVVAACTLSGVSDFASRNPMGLKMPAGERGRALSGGQRQAVALARAIVRAPRLLFLDEPSSALDNASEADLVRRLREWAEQTGATLLISSQRMAMLDLCERLIVLDQGRVVADGAKGDVLRLLSGRAATPAAQAQG